MKRARERAQGRYSLNSERSATGAPIEPGTAVMRDCRRICAEARDQPQATRFRWILRQLPGEALQVQGERPLALFLAMSVRAALCEEEQVVGTSAEIAEWTSAILPHLALESLRRRGFFYRVTPPADPFDPQDGVSWELSVLGRSAGKRLLQQLQREGHEIS